jgi:hypothetical protein
MGWATFWAIFSQTHLVTLDPEPKSWMNKSFQPSDFFSEGAEKRRKKSFFFDAEILLLPTSKLNRNNENHGKKLSDVKEHVFSSFFQVFFRVFFSCRQKKL